MSFCMAVLPVGQGIRARIICQFPRMPLSGRTIPTPKQRRLPPTNAPVATFGGQPLSVNWFAAIFFLLYSYLVVGSERTERECGAGLSAQSRGCPRNCKR